MGWFRISTNFGSSVVVRAGNREEAIKQVWNALEELSRGAVEGLRLGSYVVSEEPGPSLDGIPLANDLCALVYAPARQRARPSQAGPSQHSECESPPRVVP
jgi:hypothetical protein